MTQQRRSDFVCMTFRGVPITEMSKEDLLKTCTWALNRVYEMDARFEFYPDLRVGSNITPNDEDTAE